MSCIEKCSTASLFLSSKLHQLLRILSALDARWARFLCKRPVAVFVACIIITGGLGCGWLRMKTEESSEVLWVPRESKAGDDDQWVKKSFGVSGGGASFYSTVRSNWSSVYGTNVFQLPTTYEMFKIDEEIRNMVVTHSGLTYTYEDLCYRSLQGVCDFSDYLQYWDRDIAKYLTAVGGSISDPTAGYPEAIVQTVNNPKFPDNSSVSVLSIYGGIELEHMNMAGNDIIYLASARVVVISYSLKSSVPDAVSDKWYSSFIETMKTWQTRLAYSDAAYIAETSPDEEIGRSLTDNIYLIIIAVIIFIVVTIVGLSHPHPVATRTVLGLLGVLAAVFGMVCGYGLSMIFGIPFTILVEVLPFILLGMAVDCVFILTKAYDVESVRDPSLTLTQRMVKVLSTAGLSVQVTTMASTVAFALGCISELPSIQWFSIFATMCTFCIMISSTVFFMAAFVLTEWRISRNRFECFCCFRSARPLPPLAAVVDNGIDPIYATSDNGNGNSKSSGPMAAPVALQMEVVRGAQVNGKEGTAPFPNIIKNASKGLSGGGDAPKSFWQEIRMQQNLMKYLVEKFYGPAVTHPIGKAVILVIFATYFCISIVGSTRLDEGQPLQDIAPDDSYLRQYINVAEDTFKKQVGMPTNLYFRHVDPSYPVIQEKMLVSLGLVLQSPYVNSTISAFMGNWLLSFLEWVPSSHPEVVLVSGCANPYAEPGMVTGDLGTFASVKSTSGCVPQTQFYALLDEFLDTNPGYRDSLLRDADGFIWANRMGAVHRAPFDEGKYGRLSLKAIRNVERQANSKVFVAENAEFQGKLRNKALWAQWASEFGAKKGAQVFLINNGDYLFSEGDAILGKMTLEYVLLALAGVGVVMIVMLGSVITCILMIIAVGFVDLFLFGEMWFLGLRFNQVSVICLVMATGLAVDYSIYFAQKFMVVEGTRDQRVRVALADTGSAVFLGGLCALLGSIPLAFASSVILRTFFALIFGTIVFSLLVGLTLMPVVLSLIGPAAIPQVYDDGGIEATATAPVTGKEGKETVAESV